MMANHPNRNKAKRAPKAAPVRRAAATSAPASRRREHEHDYRGLLLGVERSFGYAASSGTKLFLTDAEGLNDLYLDSLPSERQVHTCTACRRFIETFGGLVHVAATGEQMPAMWRPETVPEFYRPAFEALHGRVARARITSVFLTPLKVWGTPATGPWTHMAVDVPNHLVFKGAALTAEQSMAAAKENVRTVATALTTFTPAMLDQALRLLDGDHLSRSEKFIGPVRWLRGLHDRPKGTIGHNLLWAAVAEAPEGYCHPRSSVIGPLLEDVAAGFPFDKIKKKFDAMLHPLRYQRPQAPPASGNIAAAEALVEKLGLAPSLERRFARIDELQTIWVPGAPPTAQMKGHEGGVFSHIKPKGVDSVPPVELPPVTMTWLKFSSVALPAAERVEMLIPSKGSFIAMTTAADPDAPPILKWDREEARNPFAVYVYHGGSMASQWGLRGGEWVRVTALTPQPSMWGDRPMDFLGTGVIAVLEGAVDSNLQSGNAIFPENLRDDLHGIRATVEAYSKAAEIAGRREASACGYSISKASAAVTLRVFANGSWSAYRIDRWD